jgi:transposase
VQKQTRVKNQIKSFLAFYGIHITEEQSAKHWSNNYIKWLETVSIKHESGKKALQMYLSELKYLKQIIAEITRSVRILGQTDQYKEQVELLITVPGIGILTAMILLTEPADIKRFNKLDRLCSYIGLVPTEHSSGEHIGRGNITPRRNRFLRHILIESSWVAIRKDPALMLANKKYRSSGKNGPKAIIKVARKLVSRIYQVLKQQRPYQLAIAD